MCCHFWGLTISYTCTSLCIIEQWQTQHGDIRATIQPMIFDISQLTIHSAPNSAARSAFKWQFENWKTFWCLNKDHKINIPASHQCLIAGQMNKNGNSSRNINEIRNKTFTICIRPYSIWEKKKKLLICSIMLWSHISWLLFVYNYFRHFPR